MVAASYILQKFGLINHSLINQQETYLSLFTLATVGFLGMVDDYMNIKGIGKSKGLSVKFKMVWLLAFATLGALWFYYKLDWSTHTLAIPFLEHGISIGAWFIPLFIFIIVAFSNSVNITD
jgi:phospho-N-acetylmuramoyl-pentapeptide-transferase